MRRSCKLALDLLSRADDDIQLEHHLGFDAMRTFSLIDLVVLEILTCIVQDMFDFTWP